jgi:ABC-2 type transport system ATP-binding protein
MNDTPAIVLEGLVKRFPATGRGRGAAAEVVAVAGVDLTVRAGECLAVLGPNGAGKTTTVEMIEGLTEPTAGTITIFGVRWGASRAGDQRIRASLGVQLQETHFQERLTVRETAALFSAFYPNPRPPDEALAEVSLESKANAPVGKLSGGQRQRLALACALVGRPRLLCLDEPTTGLDPQSRRQIWEIVERFQGDGGTVLLTTHYMEEAAQLADRVAIMDHGKVIALDTPDALIASLGAADIIECETDRPLELGSLAGLPGLADQGAQALDHDSGRHRVRLTVTHVGLALPALLAHLERDKVALISMTTHRATLEDVFVHHTGRGLRDG